MKKFIFYPIFAAALLSFVVVACDEDKIKEEAKPVDVTITVTLPASHDGLSLADVPKDSVKVSVGDNDFYTDADGKVSATVEEGQYQLSATLTKVVVGQNSSGQNGQHLINFLGTGNAEFSEASKTATIELRVSGTPTFTAYGQIVATVDTIHLWYKGDTADLSPLFTATLQPGDTRTTTFTYEIVAQPKKSETGGNATGAWVDLPDAYAIAGDHLLIATDSLAAAAFDLTAITGRKREVSPAVVRATLRAGGELIAQTDVPVVQDSVVPELVGIVPTTDAANNVGTRLIPGTNTFTVAAPFAGNGLIVSPSGHFGGYYSDGTITTTLAPQMILDPETYVSTYLYKVHIEAANDNGSSIPGPDGDVSNNPGYPISAGTAGSGANLRVNIDNFNVNRSTNTVEQSATGQFYIYPANSTKDDFRTLHLIVKTVSVTGITPLTDDASQQGGPTRRLRQGNAAATQARFFANLRVSEGPDRGYDPDENNGIPLLVIKDSWTPTGALELVTTTTPQKTASLSLNDGVTYIAAGYVKFTTEGTALPADAPITFKVCPKDKFDATGVPDPEWTITVTTKVYAE